MLGAPFPRPVPARRLAVGAGAALAVVLGLTGCGQPASPVPAASTAVPSSVTAPTPAPTGPAGSGGTTTCDYPAAGQSAKAVKPPPTTDVPTTGTVVYTLALTGGKVQITMDRAKAPCTVNSFASLADQGYFNGTRCHRLVDSGIFVLQCGDPTGTGSGGPGYAFANETTGKESYKSGVVAMANAGPDTNGSQFFLVWSDSTQLDDTPNYTIFGQMDTASRDVVAQMAGEGEDGSLGQGQGKPNNPSEISTVTKG